MSNVIHHIWGTEHIIKKNESCLIRVLKIKSGGTVKLFLKPETVYIQSGSIVCLETGSVFEEGSGDIFFDDENSFNFTALCDSTIFETCYLH